MERLFYYEEHISCKHYASDVRAGFKFMDIESGTELTNEENDINYLVFITKGEIDILYNQSSHHCFYAGEIFLIPYLSSMSAKALSDVSLMVCLFTKPTNLCTKTEFESLSPLCESIHFTFTGLKIKPMLTLFLELLRRYLQDGISCKHLYEMKHQEMFLLFRIYYSKKELANLFHPIIGRTLDFKEKVIDNYLRCSKVQELADCCGYSVNRFAEKFKEEFHSTPFEWMQKQKTTYIKSRLSDTSLPIKEIVDEFQFASQSHLNTYCKKFFEMTAVELREKLTAENKKIRKHIHQ
ncbi:helix-turn-helix domain-containing protein [Bacteroides sp.]|uniref:helix-turn-helix domain-containing protein n=1 Tax=Bacteroides sp. TaxID=29523 RepID=UPI002FC7CA34